MIQTVQMGVSDRTTSGFHTLILDSLCPDIPTHPPGQRTYFVYDTLSPPWRVPNQSTIGRHQSWTSTRKFSTDLRLLLLHSSLWCNRTLYNERTWPYLRYKYSARSKKEDSTAKEIERTLCQDSRIQPSRTSSFLSRHFLLPGRSMGCTTKTPPSRKEGSPDPNLQGPCVQVQH